MSVKTTIKYKGSTILNLFVESTNSVTVVYKNTTVGTLVAGDNKKLNTKDKYLTDFIQIGSKTLNTKNKDLTDFILIIVESNWEDPVQEGDNLKATQAYLTTLTGPYLEVL